MMRGRDRAEIDRERGEGERESVTNYFKMESMQHTKNTDEQVPFTPIKMKV